MTKPLNLRAAPEQDDKGHESFGKRFERNSSWKGRNERAEHHKGFCSPRSRTALLIQVPQSTWDGQKAIFKNYSEISEKGYVRTLWAMFMCTGQGLNGSMERLG